MEGIGFLDLFQGVGTLVAQEPKIAIGRIVLMLLGFLLVYLGKKGVLEPLLMIPMGLGMAAVNAGVLFFEGGRIGTLFVDPLVTTPDEVVNILQIDWLQPIYTFMFSNGLIACLVFMGIGVLLDVGFVMARPFQSMILALFAELGTVLIFPIGVAIGMTEREAAAVAMIGGADGPMVLFTSLMLAKHLFVPITVVGYLYLGLTYGGYPYLIKLLIPKRLRAIPMPVEKSGRSPRRRSWSLPSSCASCSASCSRSRRRSSCRCSSASRCGERPGQFSESARRNVALRLDLLPRPDARHSLRSEHHARPGGSEAAAARLPGAAALGHRRHHRRLCAVFLVPGQVQSR